MDPDAFAFSQLTKDMDDMLVGFKQGLAKTIVFYDKFFEKFSKKSMEYKFTN